MLGPWNQQTNIYGTTTIILQLIVDSVAFVNIFKEYKYTTDRNFFVRSSHNQAFVKFSLTDFRTIRPSCASVWKQTFQRFRCSITYKGFRATLTEMPDLYTPRWHHSQTWNFSKNQKESFQWKIGTVAKNRTKDPMDANMVLYHTNSISPPKSVSY